MKKERVYRSTKSVQEVSSRLSDWIVSDLQFPMPELSTRGETLILRTRKTGVLRQLAGLVFGLTVEFTPTGAGFMAVVDNGDIRDQLASLGIAIFIAWPILLTSGYAMWAKNLVVDQALDKIGEFA